MLLRICALERTAELTECTSVLSRAVTSHLDDLRIKELHTVCARVEPWKDTRAVRELNKRLVGRGGLAGALTAVPGLSAQRITPRPGNCVHLEPLDHFWPQLGVTIDKLSGAVEQLAASELLQHGDHLQ
jgi:hypothetical protein